MTVRRTTSRTSAPKAPPKSAAKSTASKKSEAPRKAQKTNGAWAADGSGQRSNDAVNRFDGKSHTASVEMTKEARASAINAQSKVVADTVMNVIGSYDKHFLLATDGLKSHVQQVAARFISEADTSSKSGSAYAQLSAKYPGAHILLVGTASLSEHDQVYYLVRTKGGEVHKFENNGGRLKEVPDANGQIFMASELGPGKKMKVRVPDVQFLINPTLPPDYGVGRHIDVVLDTPVAAQMKNASDRTEAQGSGIVKEILPGDAKGEDGTPLGVVLSPQREFKGEIVKYNGDHTYDVKVTKPDGSTSIVKETEQQIREQNDPTIYSLTGSQYDDVSINVNTDPVLKNFIAQAQAIADKDIPKTGTPEQIAAGQKQALVDLTLLCNKTLSYPDEDANTTDQASKNFMAMMNSHSNWNPMTLGEIITAGRGVCRHQAILMQVCCQVAGIGSRMVTAKADNDQGQFRGYHAFLETTLDDGTNYLTDPTWFDAGPSNVQGRTTASPHMPDGTIEQGTPLFDTLYFNARRQVLPTWNENQFENHDMVHFRESNDPVIDGSGHVVGPQPPAPAPPPSNAGAAAFLDSVRMTEYGSDYKQWWPNWDPHSAPESAFLQFGDTYAGSNPKAAAAYYSLGIEFGDKQDPAVTKELWGKLATALSQAGYAQLAEQAKTFGA